MPQKKRAIPRAKQADRADRLWTVPELLAYLHISRSTFYRWRSKGILPEGRKLGGTWRFTQAELDGVMQATATA